MKKFRNFVKTCRKLDISLQHPFFIHPIQIKLEIKIYPIDFVDPGEDPTLLKLVKDLFLDEKTSDFKVRYLSFGLIRTFFKCVQYGLL